ncbi:DHHC zinc finger domain-containing protein [Blastopirellula marina]|nr:DHHC zinc finger domain-containing protein [Blastopirellula marina]
MMTPEPSLPLSDSTPPEEDVRRSWGTLRRDRVMAMLAGMGLMLTYGLTFFVGFLLSWIFAGDTPDFDWVDPVYFVLFWVVMVLLPFTLLFGMFAAYRLARHSLPLFATMVVTLLAGIPVLSVLILAGLVVRTGRQSPATPPMT